MEKKVAWPRSRDILFKFCDPLISREWLKIRISNFACGLKARDTKSKNEKQIKRGRGLGHVTYFLNFGTPLISLERLKIKTSNFASAMIVRDTKRKMKNRSKGGVAWPTFQILDPPNISGTAEDTNLKFCRRIVGKRYYIKKWKIGQKGAWPRSRDLLFKFSDPSNISETAEDTNLKFCRHIDRKGY